MNFQFPQSEAYLTKLLRIEQVKGTQMADGFSIPNVFETESKVYGLDIYSGRSTATWV